MAKCVHVKDGNNYYEIARTQAAGGSEMCG